MRCARPVAPLLAPCGDPRARAIHTARRACASAAPRRILNLRDHFELDANRSLGWFPGHMLSAMRKMGRQMQEIDYVIEVHDARTPLTGRNPMVQSLGRPSTLLLNKTDLADLSLNGKATALLAHKSPAQKVVFTSLRQPLEGQLMEILAHVREVVPKDVVHSSAGVKIMVVGVPNVGKSSLINALHIHRKSNGFVRRGKVAVGAVPGITRTVGQPIIISESPRTIVFDTPGVLLPSAVSVQERMKLAAIGCFPDHTVGEALIADYILYALNKRRIFEYLMWYGVDEPNDSIEHMLQHVGMHIGALGKGGTINTDLAAARILKDFRRGRLGKINMDDHLLQMTPSEYLRFESQRVERLQRIASERASAKANAKAGADFPGPSDGSAEGNRREKAEWSPLAGRQKWTPRK